MSFKEFLKENAARMQAPVSYLIRLALIISVIYAIYFNLWRILFINILLLILIFIPVLSKKVNISVPREIEYVLLLFAVISFFLGDIRGLVIQIFFGLAVGFIGFALMIILYRNSGLKPNYPLIILFALSISIALGTFSELAKYYLKLFLNYESSMGDYIYAMASLGLVFIGALFASFFGYFYMKGSSFSLLDNMVKKFKSKNPNLFIEKTDSPQEIMELIKRGENQKHEFKSTLRTNLYTGDHDRKIEQSILKTIASFLNTEGGILLIGVSDNGLIAGIEKDHFQSNDKFNLHFTNLVKEYIGNNNLLYLHFELVSVEDKHIMKVDCMKSEKPVFLTFHKIEEFYVRIGSATVQLTGSKLVDYINNNFNK